ncbi:MAG: hypothetical protein IT448_08655 [Phycisphaerales bacterium]|nr:hypothetical protein [Phycisphaerales bacterium]
MRLSIVGLAALGLFVGVVGCEKSETPKVPAAPAAKSPEAQAQDAAKSVTNAVEQKSQEVTQAVTDAKKAVEDSGVADQAQKLLDQAVEYAKDNKYDLAEKAIKQAEELPGIPQSIKDKIPQVRQMVESLKAAGNAGAAGKAVEGLVK